MVQLEQKNNIIVALYNIHVFYILIAQTAFLPLPSKSFDVVFAKLSSSKQVALHRKLQGDPEERYDTHNIKRLGESFL